MANMSTAVELRQKRAGIVAQMREVLDAAEKEKRGLSAEEQQKYDRMETEERSLKETIDRIERQEQLDAEMRASTTDPVRPSTGDPEKRTKSVFDTDEYRQAFFADMRKTTTPEQRALLDSTLTSMPAEFRALSAITGGAGGYLVPQGFYGKVISGQKAYGGLRASRAEVMTTVNGIDIPIPMNNDTGNEGDQVDENTSLGEQDTAFTVKNLKAYLYSSKMVRVPWALLQDTGIDLEAYLAKILSERLGRATNRKFTLGTGVSQPTGVVTAALEGKVGLTTTGITFEEITDLEHSVDPAYRLSAEFMMHDTTVSAIKKLKDSTGRPLWQPGIAFSEPDRLNGYRYVVNQHMATMAAAAKSILFGDFSLYKIRDVSGMVLLRLNERYAEQGQVAFLAWSRHDGLLADAGTGPVKYFQNALA